MLPSLRLQNESSRFVEVPMPSHSIKFFARFVQIVTPAKLVTIHLSRLRLHNTAQKWGPTPVESMSEFG
jgi:hypothetical protein